jgi:hypothetical protein
MAIKTSSNRTAPIVASKIAPIILITTSLPRTEPILYRCCRVFKCKACHWQFSAISGNLLACRKLPFEPYSGLQSVRQRRQGTEQPLVEPQPRCSSQTRICLTSQAIETFIDHHGPDDVWRADQLPCLAKRVEHAAG